MTRLLHWFTLLALPVGLAAEAERPPEHPIEALMQTVTWRVRPELRGIHPRVFVTEEELETLRERARTTHLALWQDVTDDLGALEYEPAPAPAQERRAQNTVAIRLAEISFAWAIDRDPRYLEAARTYLEAALSYEDWGYTSNKPNVDLGAGHMLYGVAWAYDLLYDALTEDERARIRARLVRQGELLYEDLAPWPGRTYPYSQNHLFIPAAGLAVAGFALQGEAPEADDWSRLARALYDRVLTTYSPDGYYYEGFEYWVFSTPWIVHFLDAHAHATGEDLYARAPGLASAHLYLAHETLPGGADAFDFGDVYSGPTGRTGRDPDRERTHPGGRLVTNRNLLYRLAERYGDPDVQGVADFLGSLGQVDAEAYWTLAWRDPDLPSTPIEALPPWHHFPDHDVVYWRTGWDEDATAFAFKCGPPHGHHAAALLDELPDWRMSAGHAHPDANSFILYGHGAYLTGDSGYAGVPRAEQHNTLLVDGQGQAAEGEGHDAWAGYPYARLDAVRITQVTLAEGSAYVEGDATTAYREALGVERFVRGFLVSDAETVTVWDEVQTRRPVELTSVLHAEETAQVEGSTVELAAGELTVRVLAPEVRLEVEPNAMIGPGRPGSIGVGKVVARGERVLVTPVTPARHTTFAYELRIGGR